MRARNCLNQRAPWDLFALGSVLAVLVYQSILLSDFKTSRIVKIDMEMLLRCPGAAFQKQQQRSFWRHHFENSKAFLIQEESLSIWEDESLFSFPLVKQVIFNKHGHLAENASPTNPQEYSLPYTPQFAQCKDPSTEFYVEELNKCCSQCPPGQYKTESCTHTLDTKCRPCRPNTYTAIWNWSPQCFACSPPCRKGLVENQTCTRSQDRICSCPPHKYCLSKIQEYCRACRVHKKCGKGYRVSRRGTDSTDTECKPCPPGTFSPEESYDTSCTPHTVCKAVAVPGNSRNDTVCSDSGTATVLPHTILNLLLTQSSAPHRPEIITRPVMVNPVPDLSATIGAVAGPLLLVLIIAILGYCLVTNKKAPLFSAPATEADLPFPLPEKQCDQKARDTGLQNCSSSEQEQQHLLGTSGSSSGNLNNPTARISVESEKNDEKRKPEGFQQRHPPTAGSKLHSGDRHSSVSSEHSGNGGRQVNVTCIVKVCSPDCSSQCPEQMDYGNTPCYSPAGEETPLSKEENLSKSETEVPISVENEDHLLQDLLPEEKKVPLGIQDAGMKTS